MLRSQRRRSSSIRLAVVAVTLSIYIYVCAYVCVCVCHVRTQNCAFSAVERQPFSETFRDSVGVYIDSIVYIVYIQ